MTVETLLARLDKVKPYGKGSWRACCPAHGGKDANMKVSLSDDGRILIKCFSHGCDTYSILQSVGLDWNDVFPEKLTEGKTKPVPNLLSSGEGLRILRYEAQVVLATAYLLRKEKFNMNDIERMELSMTRINNVMEACGLK